EHPVVEEVGDIGRLFVVGGAAVGELEGFNGEGGEALCHLGLEGLSRFFLFGEAEVSMKAVGGECVDDLGVGAAGQGKFLRGAFGGAGLGEKHGGGGQHVGRIGQVGAPVGDDDGQAVGDGGSQPGVKREFVILGQGVPEVGSQFVSAEAARPAAGP